MKATIVQQAKVRKQQVLTSVLLQQLKGGKGNEQESNSEASIIIEDDLGV